MDEAVWLVSTDPAAMLRHLEAVRVYGRSRTDPSSPVTDRKLRLFEDACFERFGLNLEDVTVQTWRPLGVCDLLRCLFGNPFRPARLPGPPCPDCDEGAPDENCDDCGGSGTVPGPCPWVTPAVTALARHAYEARDWAALGPLSDALEQAGCDDAALLAHLRETVPCANCGGQVRYQPSEAGCLECHSTGRLPAPHARGCWPLDLLLAKE